MGSVIKELQYAEQLTRDNDVLTLTMCVNYGGRVELVDAMRAIAEDVAAGRVKPKAISEKMIRRNLYVPDMPDVDLFLRSSGEQRTRTSCCGVGVRRDGVPRHALARLLT